MLTAADTNPAITKHITLSVILHETKCVKILRGYLIVMYETKISVFYNAYKAGAIKLFNNKAHFELQVTNDQMKKDTRVMYQISIR